MEVPTGPGIVSARCSRHLFIACFVTFVVAVGNVGGVKEELHTSTSGSQTFTVGKDQKPLIAMVDSVYDGVGDSQSVITGGVGSTVTTLAVKGVGGVPDELTWGQGGSWTGVGLQPASAGRPSVPHTIHLTVQLPPNFGSQGESETEYEGSTARPSPQVDVSSTIWQQQRESSVVSVSHQHTSQEQQQLKPGSFLAQSTGPLQEPVNPGFRVDSGPQPGAENAARVDPPRSAMHNDYVYLRSRLDPHSTRHDMKHSNVRRAVPTEASLPANMENVDPGPSVLDRLGTGERSQTTTFGNGQTRTFPQDIGTANRQSYNLLRGQRVVAEQQPLFRRSRNYFQRPSSSVGQGLQNDVSLGRRGSLTSSRTITPGRQSVLSSLSPNGASGLGFSRSFNSRRGFGQWRANADDGCGSGSPSGFQRTQSTFLQRLCPRGSQQRRLQQQQQTRQRPVQARPGLATTVRGVARGGPSLQPTSGTAGSFVDPDMSIDEIITVAYGPGISNIPLTTEEGQEVYFISGLDMKLTWTQYSTLEPFDSVSSTLGARFKRKASVFNKWPGVEIPFEIGQGFDGYDVDIIRSAMAQWETQTCVRFRPATSMDRNRLVFEGGMGCSSNVGMIGGAQRLTLQEECRRPKIVLHEIGHALGLIHEHQRPDRDQYIAINRENIRPGRQRDFERFGPARVQNLGVGYDYMSIMHYGQTAFSRDPHLVTMITRDPSFQQLIGKTQQLSSSDIETINRMYKCGGQTMEMPPLPGAELAAGAGHAGVLNSPLHASIISRQAAPYRASVPIAGRARQPAGRGLTRAGPLGRAFFPAGRFQQTRPAILDYYPAMEHEKERYQVTRKLTNGTLVPDVVIATEPHVIPA
ncbi:hypothetical protein BaRGS_00023307, partial [Batillaria attramentaria]